LEKIILLRHGAPGKLDEAPYGTQYRVQQGDNFDLYIQRNTDSENPHWELIGVFYNETTDEAIQEVVDKRLTPIL